jgi:hypothetical protein
VLVVEVPAVPLVPEVLAVSVAVPAVRSAVPLLMVLRILTEVNAIFPEQILLLYRSIMHAEYTD